MSKLYKDKDSGELVLISGERFSTTMQVSLTKTVCWVAADSLAVEYAMRRGKLILIGNNFRLK